MGIQESDRPAFSVGGRAMVAKYLKIKLNGKWTFKPIPTMFIEYNLKQLCECDACKYRRDVNISAVKEMTR